MWLPELSLTLFMEMSDVLSEAHLFIYVKRKLVVAFRYICIGEIRAGLTIERTFDPS
jgi:hypothetical protein